ncbi:MAG: signal peptidase II [Candidatus Dormibacteria bacterium]
MRFSLRAFVVLMATAAVVFLADHLVKRVVSNAIPLGSEVGAGSPVTLHHINNHGAAFGLFPGLQNVFLVVAVLVGAYIVLAGQRFGRGALTQVVLGCILGGAAANAVDRFRQGYVVDYVDVHIWPIFNLADACIVIGILVAVLTFGGRGRRGEDAAPAPGRRAAS